jgi:hypothetical protein
MLLSVFCNEELAFSNQEKFLAELDKFPTLAPFLRRSILGDIGYSVCEYWGAGEANPVENEPVFSELPTLVLQGEFDPITPPSWGERAAQSLPNSHYFLFPGVGHGALATECARTMLVDFINDPTESPDDACLEELNGLEFDVPSGEASDVELEAFADPQGGMEGLIPIGWTEAAPGTYTRGSSALDETVLLMEAAPVPPDDILQLLAGQLGFTTEGAVPAPVNTGSLEWNVYNFEVDGLVVDLGLTEVDGATYLVLLISSDAEHEQLFEQVFLPAIGALKPLE